MRNQQVLIEDYRVSPDKLWEAVKTILTRVDGVTFEQADDAQKKASFKTGVTSTSWGQNMVAIIEPLGSEEARLHITGQLRHTFLSSNWGESVHAKTFVRTFTQALKQDLAQ